MGKFKLLIAITLLFLFIPIAIASNTFFSPSLAKDEELTISIPRSFVELQVDITSANTLITASGCTPSQITSPFSGVQYKTEFICEKPAFSFSKKVDNFFAKTTPLSEATIQVFGTEYNPGDQIRSFIQLLDNNQPVNNASCFIDIYNPDNSYFKQDQMMTSLANDQGLYYFDTLSHNITGVHMVVVECFYQTNTSNFYPVAYKVIVGVDKLDPLSEMQIDDNSYFKTEDATPKRINVYYNFSGVSLDNFSEMVITLNGILEVGGGNLGSAELAIWNFTGNKWQTLPNRWIGDDNQEDTVTNTITSAGISNLIKNGRVNIRVNDTADAGEDLKSFKIDLFKINTVNLLGEFTNEIRGGGEIHITPDVVAQVLQNVSIDLANIESIINASRDTILASINTQSILINTSAAQLNLSIVSIVDNLRFNLTSQFNTVITTVNGGNSLVIARINESDAFIYDVLANQTIYLEGVVNLTGDRVIAQLMTKIQQSEANLNISIEQAKDNIIARIDNISTLINISTFVNLSNVITNNLTINFSPSIQNNIINNITFNFTQGNILLNISPIVQNNVVVNLTNNFTQGNIFVNVTSLVNLSTIILNNLTVNFTEGNNFINISFDVLNNITVNVTEAVDFHNFTTIILNNITLNVTEAADIINLTNLIVNNITFNFTQGAILNDIVNNISFNFTQGAIINNIINNITQGDILNNITFNFTQGSIINDIVNNITFNFTQGSVINDIVNNITFNFTQGAVINDIVNNLTFNFTQGNFLFNISPVVINNITVNFTSGDFIINTTSLVNLTTTILNNITVNFTEGINIINLSPIVINTVLNNITVNVTEAVDLINITNVIVNNVTLNETIINNIQVNFSPTIENDIDPNVTVQVFPNVTALVNVSVDTTTIENIISGLNQSIGEINLSVDTLSIASSVWNFNNRTLTSFPFNVTIDGVVELSQNTTNLITGNVAASFEVGVCPANTNSGFLFAFLIIIGGFAVLGGFIFRTLIISLFGGLMMLVLSWYVAGCSGALGYLFAALGLIVLIVVAVNIFKKGDSGFD